MRQLSLSRPVIDLVCVAQQLQLLVFRFDFGEGVVQLLDVVLYLRLELSLAG